MFLLLCMFVEKFIWSLFHAVEFEKVQLNIGLEKNVCDHKWDSCEKVAF